MRNYYAIAIFAMSIVLFIGCEDEGVHESYQDTPDIYIEDTTNPDTVSSLDTIEPDTVDVEIDDGLYNGPCTVDHTSLTTPENGGYQEYQYDEYGNVVHHTTDGSILGEFDGEIDQIETHEYTYYEGTDMIHFDLLTYSRTFSSHGSVITCEDTYDLNGNRILSQCTSEKGGLRDAYTKRYEYNDAGVLVLNEMLDENGELVSRHTFTDDGQLLSFREQVGTSDEPNWREGQYIYNEDGLLIRYEMDSNDQYILVKNEYDENGRLSFYLRTNNTYATCWSYENVDTEGGGYRAESWPVVCNDPEIHPDTSLEPQFWGWDTRKVSVFDALGQQLSHTISENDSINYEEVWEYDYAGNLTYHFTTEIFVSGGWNRITMYYYRYDEMGHEISFDSYSNYTGSTLEQQHLTTQYDSAGNILRTDYRMLIVEVTNPGEGSIVEEYLSSIIYGYECWQK